jgi:hypothetical protein
MVGISTNAGEFVQQALDNPAELLSVYQHAENTIIVHEGGLTLLQFGIHFSFLHYVALENKYRVAKLAAMVPVICTISSYRGVAVDINAILLSVQQLKYMAGGTNFNYNMWYTVVLHERALQYYDGDDAQAVQFVRNRRSEDARKGATSCCTLKCSL